MTAVYNPFRDNRFEYEGQPLIWRSPTSRRLWNASKNVFVRGSRGSGKTCLLQSVDIAQVISNPMLAHQYGDEAIRTVGVYYRFPIGLRPTLEALSEALNRANIPDAQRLSQLTFARMLYVAFWTAAVDRLIKLNQVSGGIATERREADLVLELSRLAQRHGVELQLPHMPSLRDLSDQWEIYRQRQLDAIGTRDLPVLRQAITAFNDPGQCFVELAEILLNVIAELGVKLASNARVLMMLDEFDKLALWQQIYANSLVRDTRHPLFWCPAYVSAGTETSRTVIETTSLSNADRLVIDLDDPDESDFPSFCANVASIRLYYRAKNIDDANGKKNILGPNDRPETFFSLDKRLGAPTLNALFQRKLKGSKKDPEVRQIEEIAARLEGKKVASLTDPDFEIKEGDKPVLQAQLVVAGYLKEREYEVRGKSEAAFHAGLRRKLRGAFLVAARRFKWRPLPWAGARIAISLSDNCIRDFLDIMNALYEGHANPRSGSRSPPERREPAILKGFCEAGHPLGDEAQAKAFLRASAEYTRSLATKKDAEGSAVYRLVHFLGRLTWELQTNDRLGALATPERGVFLVDLRRDGRRGDLAEDEIMAVRRVINTAISDGYVRLIQRDRRMKVIETESFEESEIFRIRLHRRFSPQFGFSYLGAIEDTPLPLSFLATAILNQGAEIETLSVEAAERISTFRNHSLHASGWDESAQYSLPLTGDDDEGR